MTGVNSDFKALELAFFIILASAIIFFVDVLSVAVFLAASVIIIYFISPVKKIYAMVWYLLSVVVMALLYHQYQLQFGAEYPYYIGGSDDLMYESYAKEFAERYSILDYGRLRGGLLPIWHNSPGYVYFVSIVARVGETMGGYHTVLPRVVNLLFLSASSFIVYRMARDRLGLSLHYGAMAMAIVALAPIMVYVSSHIYRDAIAAFLFISSMYIITAKRLSFAGCMLFIVLAGVMSQLRELTAVLMIFLLFIVRVMSVESRVVRISLTLLFSLFVLIAAVWLGVVDRLIMSSGAYTEYRIGLSSGFAANVFSIPLPYGLPVRMLYYVATPVPVFSSEFSSIYLAVGTVLQMMFFPCTIVTLIYSLKLKAERNVKIISYMFVGLWAGLSITTFTERHMLTFYPLGVLLLVYGMEKIGFIRKNKMVLFFVSGFFTVLFIGLYFIIKYF